VTEPDRTFDLDAEGGGAALKVAAGGLGAIVLGWILGWRFLRLLGLLAALVGGGLYAQAKLAERNRKIEEAEERIRSELDDLDPVARAQVLKGVAES
jgi:hypothetical protein